MPDEPPIESLSIALVDRTSILAGELQIDGCEYCDADAEIPFDWLLDKISGVNQERADFLMERVGKCPRCRAEVGEKTLVTWGDGGCE